MRSTLSIFILAFGLILACLPDLHAGTDVQVLNLKMAGKTRALNGPLLGASTSAFYERLLEDPAKVETLKSMSIGLDRFPGGSDANFYNWRTGLFDIPVYPDSSAYVKFWNQAAARIAKGKPQGITMEDYESFSQEIGAQVVFVPNLETSSISEQTAWFQHLASKGAVPQRIELGNEFWIAMGNDPDSLKRWPDGPSALRTMKQYVEALKPYFPEGAKVAVQAAGGAVGIPKNTKIKFFQRLQQWDLDLHPEPWFDAVTLHLYPRLKSILGDREAGSTPPMPENAMARFNAVMAYGDEGIDSILCDIEKRLPGKEIWITEWNSRCANTATQRADAAEPLSPAMHMLLGTRMVLVYLNHPSVTQALFFMFTFNPKDPFSVFVSNGKGGYAPVPVAAALRWLNEAANHSDSFQRIVQDGAKDIDGVGNASSYSYNPIEGGLFQSKDRTILILENASADSYSMDSTLATSDKKPSSIQDISMPNLADPAKLPAKIETQAPAATIQIKPFSVTRVVWE